MKFADTGRKRTGLVVALSALRSEASPACGEFPDLVLLGELARRWSFDLVQLLPVNDTGGMNSPYMALSAFALHPLYLRIADLPEAARAPDIVGRARRLAESHAGISRLAYHEYLSAKLDLLERLFISAYPGPDIDAKLAALPGFEAWMRANPWVRPYSVFMELKRREGQGPWWSWSSRREPGADGVERLWAAPEFRSGTRFRAWLQFSLDAPFGAATKALASMGIELLGDIPILIGKDSADVWADRSIFKLEVSAGSPPDGENPNGQNWGFPAWNWEELERRDFDFWRLRLEVASRWYSAYRIDHVLGFFRIWTTGARERDAWLGAFHPTVPVTREDLEGLGFDSGRFRWLSRPHIREARLVEAAGGDASAAARAASLVLERIGDEALFLFRGDIGGTADLVARLADVDGSLRDFLLAAWRDRCLYEFEPGHFVPSWGFRSSTSWASLSEGERSALEGLFAARARESEALHEATGRGLLRKLAAFTDMLPTAEDLGGIPPYVPKVLDELGILGLRVWRWTRRWNEAGQPFIAAADYPPNSVVCPSVHDSSSLREWWEREADRSLVWNFATTSLGREASPAPERLGPDDARFLLEALACAASKIAVFPMQDLLAMSEAFRPADPAAERINVPGTDNPWNWGWRLPATIEALMADSGLARSAALVAAQRAGKKEG